VGPDPPYQAASSCLGGEKSRSNRCGGFGFSERAGPLANHPAGSRRLSLVGWARPTIFAAGESTRDCVPNPHGNDVSPKGPPQTSPGQSEAAPAAQRRPGSPDHQDEALTGRHNDLHECISETSRCTSGSGSVAPKIRVVCASTGKALPHGRASDFRFVRLLGASIVSPLQGSVWRRSFYPGRRCALPWAYLFTPLGGEFCGSSFGASLVPFLQFTALPGRGERTSRASAHARHMLLGAILSPLPGLSLFEALKPTAHAVGYLSIAPAGANVLQPSDDGITSAKAILLLIAG